jgi:GDP-L-fucose synthase
MKLLITGAGGMVGCNLLAHIPKDSVEILAPSSKALDLLDPVATRHYLATQQPDTIVHLAAVVGGIQANLDEPVRYLAANTQIALNLFSAAREIGVRKILNVASSCMYPKGIQDPLTVDLLMKAPLEPTNEGYAIGKIFSWKMLEYMSKEDPRLIYKTIVPCNLYGPYDHFDLRRSHMVAAAIMKVVAAKQNRAESVTIWGDGTARREFMFASDLANFIWWALPQLDRLPNPLNVGIGRDWSVKDYYEQIATHVGYNGSFDFDVSRPAGMARKLLDVSVVNGLGWTATTSLSAGLSDTIAYYLGRTQQD